VKKVVSDNEKGTMSRKVHIYGNHGALVSRARIPKDTGKCQHYIMSTLQGALKWLPQFLRPSTGAKDYLSLPVIRPEERALASDPGRDLRQGRNRLALVPGRRS